MPEIRSKSSQTDKKRWREQMREDVDHVLKEVWCLEPEETFYTIFYKFPEMGVEPILKLPQEDLKTLE